MKQMDHDVLRTEEISEKAIERFPRMLDKTPHLVPRLETYFKWEKSKKPSEVLMTWEKQESETMYYFLGWFEVTLEELGFTAQLQFFSLSERRNLVREMEESIVEANSKEIAAYNRGKKDTRRKK